MRYGVVQHDGINVIGRGQHGALTSVEQGMVFGVIIRVPKQHVGQRDLEECDACSPRLSGLIEQLADGLGIKHPARFPFSFVLQAMPQPQGLTEVLLMDTGDFSVLGSPVKTLDQ